MTTGGAYKNLVHSADPDEIDHLESYLNQQIPALGDKSELGLSSSSTLVSTEATTALVLIITLAIAWFAWYKRDAVLKPHDDTEWRNLE